MDSDDLTDGQLAELTGQIFGEDDAAAVATLEAPDGEQPNDDTPASDAPETPDEPAAETPSPSEPPALDYESDANPYRAQALERQRILDAITANAQQMRTQKAEQERVTKMNSWLDQQSDGDPYTRHQLEQQLQEAQRPWQQRNQEAESETEARSRMVVALMAAAETELDPATYERLQKRVDELSAYETPESMMTTAKRIREHNDQVAGYEKQIAEYKKQVALKAKADARLASGADVADGTTGGAPRREGDRPRSAFEDWGFQALGLDLRDEDFA